MKTTRSPGANSGLPSSRLRITACHPLMRARKRRSALGWGWTASISTTLAITDDMGVPFQARGGLSRHPVSLCDILQHAPEQSAAPIRQTQPQTLADLRMNVFEPYFEI